LCFSIQFNQSDEFRISNRNFAPAVIDISARNGYDEENSTLRRVRTEEIKQGEQKPERRT